MLPAEPVVRACLRRRGVSEDVVDDLLQEAYCRIADMASVDHVERPGAYLMQVVRNLHLERLRRERVVRFDAITEIDISSIESEEAGPERHAAASLLLARVDRLLQELPERCRTILRLRRVEGLPQRQIAERLGVSEHVVENDVQKAVRHLMQALKIDGQESESHGRDRSRRRS